jgi:tetratricopeptide (TPR) repeat protein
MENFPRARTEAEAQGEIRGTVVSFEQANGQARALVRFEGNGFRYSYHAYDLVTERGGRVRIVDWFDYYQGSWFSEDVGNDLVKLMPTQRAVASALELPAPDSGQLFQVGELLKSARDRNPRRYFEILDNMDEVLREEPFIVIMNFDWCRLVGDPRRLQGAAGDLARLFPGDARFALGLAEYYVQRGRFEAAIAQFDTLETTLGVKDGVLESLKATAAMALGDFERARAFAVSATESEPGLELAWWTLLRTRTAAKDYEAAIEPLTALEERFGHLLIPQALRRDPFLKVLIEQPEYQQWRAARDGA